MRYCSVGLQGTCTVERARKACQLMISVVIPAHNEFDAVDELVQRIGDVLNGTPSPWELILVDDGSTDGTDVRLRQIAETNPNLRVYSTRRRQGQTAALKAGLHRARGDIIVTLDADLENFPEDIPKLLEKLEGGADVVVGWRKDREGSWFSRKLPSKLANAIIRRMTHLPIHDQGCGLKVFRRWVINSLFLYGEHHRLISCLCAMHHATLEEIPVGHSERRSGQSKYGLKRTYQGQAKSQGDHSQQAVAEEGDG